MCGIQVCRRPDGSRCVTSWTMREPVEVHPGGSVSAKDFVSMLSWFIRHDREKAEDFAWSWYHNNVATVKSMVATADVRH